MNNYELMYIIDVSLEEEARRALIERIFTLIAENDGEVEKTDVWGKRRLPYAINDKNEGYYVLVNFTAKPELPREIERVLQINENVLRYLIIRREEKHTSVKPRQTPLHPEYARRRDSDVTSEAASGETPTPLPEAGSAQPEVSADDTPGRKSAQRRTAYLGPAIPNPLTQRRSPRNVRFLLASPKTLTPGHYTPVDIYAFVKEYEKEVRELIEEEMGQDTQTKQSGRYPLHNNISLRILLESPHAQIEDPVQHFIWTGTLCKAMFQVLVPKTYEDPQILLKARIYASNALLCTLSTALDVQKPNPSPKVETTPVEKAFVSYASKDREKVLLIVEGIQHTIPWMQIFLDVASLRTGEWEPQLFKEIDRSDIFYLFWSQHAKDSSNVEREWRYALAQKGPDFIEPVPLARPEEVPPPEELSQKHFNSWTLYY